jgi:type II secretion system (T2SS) protein E
VDDSLRALQHAADADPADSALAQRLEQALRRAEESERLRARYELKFRCPLRFEDLAPTEEGRVRDCARCERPVHLVRAPDELAQSVASGHCVAFPSEWAQDAFVRLIDDPRLDSAQETSAPCLVESQAAWLDLSPGSEGRTSITPGLGGLFAGELLVMGPVLPLRVEGGEVHVAVAQLELSEHLLDHVRLATGARKVRLFLADPTLIHELLEVHAPPAPLMMGVVAPMDYDEPSEPGESGPPILM